MEGQGGEDGVKQEPGQVDDHPTLATHCQEEQGVWQGAGTGAGHGYKFSGTKYWVSPNLEQDDAFLQQLTWNKQMFQ